MKRHARARRVYNKTYEIPFSADVRSGSENDEQALLFRDFHEFQDIRLALPIPLARFRLVQTPFDVTMRKDTKNPKRFTYIK